MTTPAPASDKSLDVKIWLGLSALVIAAYYRSLPLSFLSDDFAIIGKFIEYGVYFSFSNYFRPLPLLDLWLDTQLFGLHPFGFHLSNLVLHSVNAFLVYRFALLWLGDEAFFPALLSGVLFALLPCHSEAVIWIACRPDLLATLFSLLCLMQYTLWLREQNRKNLYLAVLAFLFAFLCKESAFALPFLLALITVFEIKSLAQAMAQLKRVSLPLALFALVLALQFFLRHVATGAWLGGEEHLVDPATPYLHNLFAYSYRALLFPVSTVADADFILSHAALIATTVLLLLLALLELSPAALRKPLAFLLLAFCAALLPILHKTITLYNIDTERYLYLPSVFLCLFLAGILHTLRQKKIAYFLFVLYCSALLFGLHGSLHRWCKASDIVVRSLDALDSGFHAEKLFVMGLPDSYRGVGVFRNGFPRAAMQFHHLKIRRKHLYMPVMLHLEDNPKAVNVTQENTAFQVFIDNASTSTLSSGNTLAVYDITPQNDHALTIVYPDMAHIDYQIMRYCDGQLRFAEHCAAATSH